MLAVSYDKSRPVNLVGAAYLAGLAPLVPLQEISLVVLVLASETLGSSFRIPSIVAQSPRHTARRHFAHIGGYRSNVTGSSAHPKVPHDKLDA
jgi:hypothetical protein